MEEFTVKTYPDGTMWNRTQAEEFAKRIIGKIWVEHDLKNHRIVDTRVESNCVVALCEPLEDEQTEPVTHREYVNPDGDKIGLHIDEEQCSVILYTHGRWTFFTMPTPKDAENLYNALTRAREIKAD